MSLQDIKELHKRIFEKQTSEKHNVFMWAIDKYLVETEKFMNELGYTLHARIVWHKLTGMAPAFTVRYTNEYLLWFYKKGKFLMLDDDTRGKYSTLITEKVKQHSQKPAAAYLMLEDMFKESSKLELFARNYRDGWDCWGNEV